MTNGKESDLHFRDELDELKSMNNPEQVKQMLEDAKKIVETTPQYPIGGYAPGNLVSGSKTS